MKILVLLFAALLVAGCGEKSLSDSAIKKALDEAVEGDSLQVRNGIYYRPNESEPYRGWVKEMYDDSEQVKRLAQCRDGRSNGLFMGWHENGQKAFEATMEDGELEGLVVVWHENGKKVAEGTAQDNLPQGLFTYWDANGTKIAEIACEEGEFISARLWNSKGEEVETTDPLVIKASLQPIIETLSELF